MRKRLYLLSGLIALLAMPMLAGAQGILLPEDDRRPAIVPPPRRPIPVQPFYVKNLRVNATITDSVAETTVEQTFVNNSSVEQEGTYLYPLPEGASPTSFTMTIGDRTMEPRILNKDEARQIYESIVRRRQDPALLEYVGRNLVRISVFPIPARGERVIRLRYTEVLKPEGGVRKYAYSLSTSRFGAKPVGVSTVTVKLKTTNALKNVYSPSHDVAIRKPDDHTATASWEGINDASDRDLALYFSTNNEEVGLSLLTYRTGDNDGYFMLLASPRVAVAKNRILPKQVVFVMDRTGSMAGEKIQQAKKSLLYCLNKLNRQDRFNVITFSDSPDTFAKQLVEATEENVAKAKRFMEDVEASGGTNIDEALRAGLTLLKNDDGKQKMLVFLTDGLPTLGETNVETILQHVKELNGGKRLADLNEPRPRAANVQSRPPNTRNSELRTQNSELNSLRLAGLQDKNPEVGAGARIFSFGVGYDVNVPFLDSLGELGRGETDYVKPAEDVEVKVSDFFAKVSSPVLSDLKLAFDGVDIFDVYPKTYPDMFKGSQLVITGRFKSGGDGMMWLAGMANGEREIFRVKAGFREADSRNNFLPRIWAARKIGYLADQIRLAKNPEANREVIDEIVRLSRDYGIITEYTSFLVDEREQARLGLNASDLRQNSLTVRDAETLRQEVARKAKQNGVSGLGATNQSLRAKDAAKADKLASRYQSANGSVYFLEGEKKEIAAAPGNFGYQGLPGPAGPRGGNIGGGGIGGGGLGGGGGIGGGGIGGGPNGEAAPGFLGGHTGAGRGRSVNDLFVGARTDRNRYPIGSTMDEAGNQVNVQAVAGKTFYRQKNNLWQDAAYDPKKQKVMNVRAFSDAHFALLRAVPKLGAYSSVGDELLVQIGRNAVQIGKTGKEKLTDAEIKQITAK